MSSPVELSPLAFLVFGLMASGHCAVMCGPLHCLASRGGQHRQLLWMQAGRASCYVLYGALAAAVGQWFLLAMQIRVPPWMHALTLAFLVALYFLRKGARNGGCRPRSKTGKPRHPFVSGMTLAMMPCPLLFGALGFAALAGNPLTGGVLMAAFAVGGSVPLLGAVHVVRIAGQELKFRRELLPWVYLTSAVFVSLPFAIRHPTAFCGL